MDTLPPGGGQNVNKQPGMLDPFRQGCKNLTVIGPNMNRDRAMKYANSTNGAREKAAEVILKGDKKEITWGSHDVFTPYDHRTNYEVAQVADGDIDGFRCLISNGAPNNLKESTEKE